MNNLSEKQLDELAKIEARIAMVEDKAQDQIYLILRRLAATFPNDYELGQAVRKLVN